MSTDTTAPLRDPTDRRPGVDPRRLGRGRRPSRGPGRGRSAREIALAAEVAALEAELDRRDRRLREVVESYESLLAEQASAGREADAFAWTAQPSSMERPQPRPGLWARLRARLPAL